MPGENRAPRSLASSPVVARGRSKQVRSRRIRRTESQSDAPIYSHRLIVRSWHAIVQYWDGCHGTRAVALPVAQSVNSTYRLRVPADAEALRESRRTVFSLQKSSFRYLLAGAPSFSAAPSSPTSPGPLAAHLGL